MAQQFRWLTNVEHAVNFLREKNTGRCTKTGKTFGELIEHFIIGGDETCLMANADGKLKILGEVGKRKHEIKVADFRGSATMYRSGNAAGNNGPTVFAMAGVRRKAAYTDEFLENNGGAPGTTIVMTDNAFMTDAAWEEIADKV